MLRDCARALSSVPVRPLLGADPAAAGASFVTAAEFHRISPGAHVVLRELAGLPTATAERLAAAHTDQLVRHVAALAGVASVAAAADGAGAAWLVLKGPHLAEVVWPRPDLRASYDLDVLVATCAVAAVFERLVAGGAVVPRQDWERMRREGHAQLSLVLPSGVVCDLHWELLALGTERRAFELSAAALFDRAITAQLGPIAAPVLAIEDALVHVGVHACLAAAGRLVWMLDLAHLLAAGPDWPTVSSRARASGTALPLAVVLQRTSSLLAVDLPAGVLDALAPRGSWRAVLAAVDRYRPVETGYRRRGMGRLLIASTRRDSPSSAAATARAGVSAARWLGRTPSPGPPLHAPPQAEDLAAARAFIRRQT